MRKNRKLIQLLKYFTFPFWKSFVRVWGWWFFVLVAGRLSRVTLRGL